MVIYIKPVIDTCPFCCDFYQVSKLFLTFKHRMQRVIVTNSHQLVQDFFHPFFSMETPTFFLVPVFLGALHPKLHGEHRTCGVLPPGPGAPPGPRAMASQFANWKPERSHDEFSSTIYFVIGPILEDLCCFSS